MSTEGQQPANLNAVLLRMGTPAPKPAKALPCTTWCSLAAMAQRPYTGAMGHCTCKEACTWEQCPMDVEAYVSPPVPRFRLDDEQAA